VTSHEINACTDITVLCRFIARLQASEVKLKIAEKELLAAAKARVEVLSRVAEVNEKIATGDAEPKPVRYVAATAWSGFDNQPGGVP
jgi:hypothetical protein